MAEAKPHSIVAAVVRIPDLLEWVAHGTLFDEAVYLYDSTDSTDDPLFLGGIRIRSYDMGENQEVHVESVPETSIHDIPKSRTSPDSDSSINIWEQS